jgi:hypothetical protein
MILNAMINVATTVVIAEKIEARAANNIVTGRIPERAMKHILHTRENDSDPPLCKQRNIVLPVDVRSSGMRMHKVHFSSQSV